MTLEELLMFNPYLLIKVAAMSSFQLKKSILVAKVEENPIYLELRVFCNFFQDNIFWETGKTPYQAAFGALKISNIVCLFSSFFVCL